MASDLGRGSTFTIWLPATKEGPLDDPAFAETAAPRLSGRILFMDDEEPIRRTAALLFRHLGLEAVIVADGADAVQEYRAAREGDSPFTAVILDLVVPGGLGGAETLPRLREIDPQVCAILATGNTAHPAAADHHAHGFAALLRKPYEAFEVAQALARVLPLS